jgi:nucleotide-binding universal stress UspA family protein
MADNLRNIVVAYDGSTWGDLAVRRALTLAKGSPFCIVHVMCVVESVEDDYVLPNGIRLSRWAALDAVRLIVRDLVDSLSLTDHRVRIVAHLRSGPAAQCIVDFAYRYHADLVLLGARGTTHSANTTAIGSVARKVLQLSSVPVYLEGTSLGFESARAEREVARWVTIEDQQPGYFDAPAPPSLRPS